MPYASREKRLDYGRRYRAAHQVRLRAYHKMLRTNRPRYTRDRKLRASYGLSIEDYDRLAAEQQGLCAICKEPESRKQFGKLKPLAVDHCHTTGLVRGLLCAGCNSALGLLREDPIIIANVLSYLNDAKTRNL